MIRKTSFIMILVSLTVMFFVVPNVFAAGPSINVSPSSGPPDSPVTMSGSGFGTFIPCTVFWDAGSIGSPTTDGVGNVNLNFTVPSGEVVGSHTVSISCVNQDSATTYFEVTSAVPTSTLTCQQTQSCTPTPAPPTPTKTCQQLQNCTPIPPTPTKTCIELQNCTPTPTETHTPTPETALTNPVVSPEQSANQTQTPVSSSTPASAGGEIPPNQPGPFSNPGVLIGGGLLGIIILGGLILGGFRLLGGGGRPGGSGSEGIGLKHDDLFGSGDGDGFGKPGSDGDPAAFGPKHEDPGFVADGDPAAFGPKHEDPGFVADGDPVAFGPKHEDPGFVADGDPVAFGPKHEDPGFVADGDPAAFGPKHEDPGLVSDESGDDLPGPGPTVIKGPGSTGTPAGSTPGEGTSGSIRPGSEGDPHATVRGPGSGGGGGDVSSGS